jgi:hypothetical protein
MKVVSHLTPIEHDPLPSCRDAREKLQVPPEMRVGRKDRLPEVPARHDVVVAGGIDLP